jgi:hypothetical protein
MRLGPFAIVVARGTERASSHPRSSHRSESTGLRAIRQYPVPPLLCRRMTRDLPRCQKRPRTKLNRALTLQMLQTTHLQRKRRIQATTVHPSDQKRRIRTQIQAQPRTRTPPHRAMSGNPSPHLLHLLPRVEAGPSIHLRPSVSRNTTTDTFAGLIYPQTCRNTCSTSKTQ